jgi:hypothetical protein
VVTLDLVIIGLATAFEPLPLTAFILVLGGSRGTVKGVCFLLGWLLSLVAVITAVLLLTGGEPLRPHTQPSTAGLAVRIAVGVGLLAVAYRQHRLRGRPRTPPRWMTRIEGMSPWTAASLGILLQPWGLVAAGAADIATMQVSSFASYALLVGFCLLCTSSLLAMEGYAIRSPEASRQRLSNLKDWMADHRDGALIGLSLIVGTWLVGQSVYLIVS